MAVFTGLRAVFSGNEKQFPPRLSSEERMRGQKLFLKFHTLNGISVAFLMDNILILYAIRNGVSDPLVAVLSSFVHLSMPFMVIGKLAASRVGLARTWAIGWLFRYISASFMIAAPFIAPYTSQRSISTLILVSAFGFALFRSIGSIATSPLEGEVANSETKGSFLSANNLRLNSSEVLSLFALILLTRQIDDLWVYQIVLAIACTIGLYASTVLARIPESNILKSSASIPLKESFIRLWNNRRARKLLFAWAAALICFMMVIPYMLVVVKNGYGVPDHMAVTFTLLLLIGGIISSIVNGMIADQVGPRPLLLLYTSGLLFPTAILAAAPQQYYPFLIGILFFLAGFCKVGIIIALNHYFLSSIDSENQVGSILCIRVLAGLVAGLAGTVLGGGLLSWFAHMGVTGMDSYRWFFRVIIVVILCMIIVVRSLEKLKEWPVKNVLRLMVSPKYLYTVHTLKRMEASAKASENLGIIKSVISEEKLHHDEGSSCSQKGFFHQNNASQLHHRLDCHQKRETAQDPTDN